MSRYASMPLALCLMIFVVFAGPTWAAVNLAPLHGVASANQWTSGYDPPLAIDGNWDTGWVNIGPTPTESNPIWLQVDLQKKYQVEEIKLVFSHLNFQPATNIYNLYVSTDGNNWNLVGSGTLTLSQDPALYINTITLTPSQVLQYVKYEAVGGTFYGSLYEMEIWGGPNPYSPPGVAANSLLLLD